MILVIIYEYLEPDISKNIAIKFLQTKHVTKKFMMALNIY